ncbi:hypothetical protein [Xanthomonas prunicola]|uniref:hypothetical protein n=1 Tax=Xanthomonas prunicola TaxID=2053930 RepID=UPI0010560650|nr:hypothetical protein [Xanthomonas prunicola]
MHVPAATDGWATCDITLLQANKEVRKLSVRTITTLHLRLLSLLGIGMSLGLQEPPSLHHDDGTALDDTCDVHCRNAGGRDCVATSEARLPSAARAAPPDTSPQ